MIRAVISYEAQKILHSSRLIIPLLVLFIYFGVAYSTAPLDILKSYSLCSLVVYLFMLCAGVVNEDMSYPVIEQTILVKMGRRSQFYIGKAAVICIISFLVSLVSVFVPVLLNVAQNNHLFTRSFAASDIISGIMLFWLIGMSGGISGLYANGRIISNRKIAVVLSALFGVLVIIKGPVIKALPEAGYIAWVLPPVHDISTAYSKAQYFSLNDTLIYFMWLAVYIIIQTAAYAGIMIKRKYE